MVNNRDDIAPARTPKVQPRQTARAYIRQDLWDAAIARNRRFVWDAGRGVALRHDDEIYLGQVRLRFEIAAPLNNVAR